MEIRVRALLGSLFRPSFVGPGTSTTVKALSSWVTLDSRQGVSPSSPDGFIERLIIQRSIQFGLRPLYPVHAIDEIVRLPEVRNLNFVKPLGNWLIRIAGERIFIRIPIRLPDYDWFPIAGVAAPHTAVWAERPLSDFDDLPAVPTDQWPLQSSNSVIPVWLPHWGQSRLLMLPYTLAPDPMYNFGNFPWSAELFGDEWHIQPHHLRQWAFPVILVPGMLFHVTSEQQSV